jgi:DNA-binding MarR family transcriptional regulator
MTIPQIGEAYRGVEGRTGYLMRQAWLELRGAVDVALREHDLTSVQYGVLTVLTRSPGASGAELARGLNISPQAMNGILATLEGDGLIERHPHPTHGRIRQVTLTDEGRRLVDASRPTVDRLERMLEQGYSEAQVAAIREWLVTAAKRMVEAADRRH